MRQRLRKRITRAKERASEVEMSEWMERGREEERERDMGAMVRQKGG